MLLLAALLQAQAPSLAVTRMVRITDGPGMRDNVVAAAGARGAVVFWEESPGIDGNGAVRPPVRIWRARLPGGSTRAVPERFIETHSNQWYPTVVATGRGALLAYYAAESTRRTGDRDIMLQPLDASFGRRGRPRRITRDGAVPLPLNDATPALGRFKSGKTIAVWSRGAFDARTGKYADKDLFIAEVRPNGSIGAERRLTGGDEKGHEVAPTLGELRDGRLLIVYVSDSAAGGKPTLYARTLDASLRAGEPRRLTSTERGVTRPSLTRAGSGLWISWYDLEASDIRIARVTSDSTLSASVSLRAVLLKAGFEKYGVPYAGLSGASLFVDRGKLGVAFVATMIYDLQAGRGQQDVFLAWF